MKVLWFTNTPSLYDQGKHNYHGGGWIEALEDIVGNDGEIDLGVAFFHRTGSTKVKRNNTTYFPINRPRARKNPFQYLTKAWFGNLLDDIFEDAFQSIVDDFQPDVIQVFGSEGPFATIQERTSIPVVIHLQGLINPSLNTYFPVNQSRLNFLMSPRFLKKNIIGSSPVFGVKRFKKQAQREAEILRKAHYVMGRTHWDRIVAELYNPNVSYFHVDEVLRTSFYQDKPTVTAANQSELSIVSTLSSTVYKGVDVLLRTAKKMTELGEFSFQWQVIGLDAHDPMLRHFERSEGIAHRDVGIVCKGRRNPEELATLLVNADVFVHPSYIDNSPNSICEAQMLGLPVIACDVGGVSSLIAHGESGFLVPSNGVFEIVHYLKSLAQNEGLAERVGKEAATVASRRHDRVSIISDLKVVYKKILS